ncbi:hypothetical protein CEUSTIGMA_g7543.t1 [Chlamydomonas eustigma]|uniref:Uncharacterized protein n=1 Tax=Chlamydomonas eustigma TaxID=1157962 RepID=A0A250XAH5_9CHLO|nr:hypothetical protein CEUSTIGMA_g7543.t1 [Chlamydomonas eustigma]|eukprot:GAX80105.1 hypothetical protein CEUSTIGMA_g7543.t1 [Chlamydomonas eustigma]
MFNQQCRKIFGTKSTRLPHNQNSCRGTTVPRHSRRREDLNDPAEIGAIGTASVKVPDQGGSVALATYMTLPVEQYFVLDPDQIKFLEGSRFLLTVPRQQFFSIWIEPDVEISVNIEASPPKVILQAENCRIRGSEVIQNMQLDKRFCLTFKTELHWCTNSNNGTSNGKNSDMDGDSVASVGTGEITANLNMNVWCEVIPPFNLMPREVLQASCNAVLSGLVGSLLPFFVRKLSEDYKKWAVDPVYRRKRAERNKPLASLEF